jgi:hypothetical protein
MLEQVNPWQFQDFHEHNRWNFQEILLRRSFFPSEEKLTRASILVFRFISLMVDEDIPNFHFVKIDKYWDRFRSARRRPRGHRSRPWELGFTQFFVFSRGETRRRVILAGRSNRR